MAKKRRHPVIRFLDHKILHVQDSPHRIALGVAIGIFFAPNPLWGLHILMIIGICILFKANKIAAIASTCINNVFTLFFIYYPTYVVGKLFCGFFNDRPALTGQQIAQIFSPGNLASGIFKKEYWVQLWDVSKSIGPELWVGSIVLGGLGSVIAYWLAYNIVKRHRAKSHHRRYAAYS